MNHRAKQRLRPGPKTSAPKGRAGKSALTLCLLLGALTGCSSVSREIPIPKQTDDDRATASPSSASSVRVESDGLTLGQADSQRVSPQQMIETVAALLREEKPANAARFVRLYPDVAWDLLRNVATDDADNPALKAIAAAHHADCGGKGVEPSWIALLEARAERPDAYRTHDEKRQKFLQYLRTGRPADALALKLQQIPDRAPGALLMIDALHLNAMALLLDNRPAEAAESLKQAIAAAENLPYQAAYLTLLQSEALRRAGHIDQADVAWTKAVRIATAGNSQGQPIADPVFWERASYLRPVDIAWPRPTSAALAKWCAGEAIALSEPPPVKQAASVDAETLAFGELSVWVTIGHYRLRRNEPQAALVALKRAEAMATREITKHRLRLLEARALLELEQTAPAVALLVQLSGVDDPRISHAAMAALGTVKLQSGNTKQGFNLLREAVEEGDSIDWPGRAQAEADLGLAYLIMGDEPAGLKWLHRAQQEFEASGSEEHLAQSLENELAYLQQAKKKNDARQVQQRLERLQSL